MEGVLVAPRLAGRSLWLLTGHNDGVPGSAAREGFFEKEGDVAEADDDASVNEGVAEA